MPLRDLAEELGLTSRALHHHVRTGKVPAEKKRNMWVVSANIAEQVRQWYADNKWNHTWPTFVEQPEASASDEGQ